jgi:hypothetical protein
MRKSKWTFPKIVGTPLGMVTTKYVKGLQGDDGTPLSGQANFIEHTLNINTEVLEEWDDMAQCRLFYHEWAHFALEAAGMGEGSLFDKKTVEAICDAISTARMVEHFSK